MKPKYLIIFMADELQIIATDTKSNTIKWFKDTKELCKELYIEVRREKTSELLAIKKPNEELKWIN